MAELDRPNSRNLTKSSKAGESEGRLWDADGPHIALRQRDGKPKGGNEPTEFKFADHSYRVKHSDGVMEYLSEPYQLTGQDCADLAWLSDNGWKVLVPPGPNRHSDTCLLVRILPV